LWLEAGRGRALGKASEIVADYKKSFAT
jgi:hypothetical protein